MQHLRAVLLALHVFAVTAMALPSAGSGLDRAAWSNPTVQEEFAAWSGRLASVGIPMDPARLQDVAYGFAVGWHRVQSAAIAPFGPYYRLCGTAQSWRMFVAPHRHPALLHVDIDRGDGWEPLYVARSSTATWRRRQLDQDRMRSAIFRYGWKAWQGRGGSYEQLGVWLAKQAAHDFPDAIRLRTRFFVYRTLPPDAIRAGRAPEGEWEAERFHRLAAFR
ncbi:MAG: hypothetical protein H6736_06150 [Alphaproteobacteria bacterium]|nr:hypothetical protein [Alphaproteobacteria bacterium]